MQTNNNESVQRYDFKFIGHESAFLHVQIETNLYDEVEYFTTVKLISYETCVCWIEYDHRFNYYKLGCSGNYSMSTIKHIRWFTEQFTGVNLYHDIRDKLKRAHQLNIEGCNIEWVDCYITDEMEDCIKKAVNMYKRDGKRFTKYSHQPNYDSLYYGYSRFNPTNL